MSNFSERFNDLLFEYQISPEQLSKALNIPVSSIYAWKKNEYSVTLSNTILLADYFKCTIDYLAGRNDSELTFIPQKCPPFLEVIKKIMNQNSISTYKLRKETHFSGSYFTRWSRGEEPYLTTLIELAEYFNCTLDQLVGREN